MADETGPYFFPRGTEAVHGDIKTGADAYDGMAMLNNLSDRFSFELFVITFTAHGPLSSESS